VQSGEEALRSSISFDLRRWQWGQGLAVLRGATSCRNATPLSLSHGHGKATGLTPVDCATVGGKVTGRTGRHCPRIATCQRDVSSSPTASTCCATSTGFGREGCRLLLLRGPLDCLRRGRRGFSLSPSPPSPPPSSPPLSACVLAHAPSGCKWGLPHGSWWHPSDEAFREVESASRLSSTLPQCGTSALEVARTTRRTYDGPGPGSRIEQVKNTAELVVSGAIRPPVPCSCGCSHYHV
jgi:hypothetical protein